MFAIKLSWLLFIVFATPACADVNRDSYSYVATPTTVLMRTSKGDIVIELYSHKAPITVGNFLKYVDSGAYRNSHFYRTTRPDNDPLIEVIQGGLWSPWLEDGDPDFSAPFPPIAHESTEKTGLTHGNGVISMGRADPGTADSEFFISIGENPELDYGGARNPDGYGFAAFGQVIEGMDVVREIHKSEVFNSDGFAGQLLIEPIVISTIERL